MTFIKYFASQNTAIIEDGASTNEFGCNTYIQSVKKNQKIKINELLNHPDISLISGPLEKKMKAENLKSTSLGNCVFLMHPRECASLSWPEVGISSNCESATVTFSYIHISFS